MEAEQPTAPTLFDLQPDPDKKVQVRRIPSLVREGIRMLLDAGRRDFLVSVALQILGGLGIVAQLLIGQRALQVLLATAGSGEGSFLSILPAGLKECRLISRFPGVRTNNRAISLLRCVP
jgi:hypothetical protein